MSDSRISKLQDFLSRSPEDPFLVHALALEWVKLGDEEKARELFEKNRTVRPEYVATYYHLGKLLERVGDTESAVNIYSEGMTQAKASGDNHSYNELQGAHDELAY
jgi:tetratricopeptide (TPR) repeat protein